MEGRGDGPAEQAGKTTTGAPQRRVRVDKLPTGDVFITEESPTNITIREGTVEIKPVDQLHNIRVQRLKDMAIKPVEYLTFDDIRNYNRDQLRAYCFVYGVIRKKKLEMEFDLARYASYYHPNDPEYDPSRYTPRDPNEKRAEKELIAEPPSIPPPAPQVTATVDAQGQPISSVRPPVGDDNTDKKEPEPSPIEMSKQQQILNEQQWRESEIQRKNWQKDHERLKIVAEKFKASFNGAGTTTATMVKNAAAYFEGRESAEAIEDKAISWERYHRNIDLLKEVFDCASPVQKKRPLDVDSQKLGRLLGITSERYTMADVEKAGAARLEKLVEEYQRLEEADDGRDRLHMKAFHRIEKATTMEEIKEAQADFERAHKLRIVEAQPRIIERPLPNPEGDNVEYEDMPGLRILNL